MQDIYPHEFLTHSIHNSVTYLEQHVALSYDDHAMQHLSNIIRYIEILTNDRNIYRTEWSYMYDKLVQQNPPQ
jgi:hypothetical protein